MGLLWTPQRHMGVGIREDGREIIGTVLANVRTIWIGFSYAIYSKRLTFKNCPPLDYNNILSVSYLITTDCTINKFAY